MVGGITRVIPNTGDSYKLIEVLFSGLRRVEGSGYSCVDFSSSLTFSPTTLYYQSEINLAGKSREVVDTSFFFGGSHSAAPTSLR